MSFLFKIILAIVGLLVVGLMLLDLRQDRLRLSHESARVYRQLQQAQSTLWRQQIDIASYTSPSAIRQASAIDEPEPTMKIPLGNPGH